LRNHRGKIQGERKRGKTTKHRTRLGEAASPTPQHIVVGGENSSPLPAECYGYGGEDGLDGIKAREHDQENKKKDSVQMAQTKR
jgi:hypothetical protein